MQHTYLTDGSTDMTSPEKELLILAKIAPACNVSQPRSLCSFGVPIFCVKLWQSRVSYCHNYVCRIDIVQIIYKNGDHTVSWRRIIMQCYDQKDTAHEYITIFTHAPN